MTEQTTQTSQFFVTAPSPCPYLAGQLEQKVFTQLPLTSGDAINAGLTLCGFRRSQNIMYRPVCRNCQACVSIRIPAAAFEADRTMKRLYKVNADITATVVSPQANEEQYALFKSYVEGRHADGSMARMTFADYRTMVGDSAVNSSLVEYRLLPPGTETFPENGGKLVGVALTDNLPDGYSMVYSFYDVQESRRSLGTFMIIDHIRRARQNNCPYVYLGYWVAGSPKMQYKARFRPQEHLGPDGWAVPQR